MPLATTRTDQHGRFSLDLERESRVRLVIVKDGFVPIHVRTGHSPYTDHQVRLEQAKQLTILVRDRFGDPIPGACVAVHVTTQWPDFWSWFLPPVASGTCDEEGRYRFRMAGPRDTLTLIVTAPGHQPQQIAVPEVP